MIGSLTQARSEFERERKAIVPLLAHGRDRGSADFWIRLDRLQESPHTFDPAVRILGVRYIAVANDIINDLGMGTVNDSPTHWLARQIHTITPPLRTRRLACLR